MSAVVAGLETLRVTAPAATAAYEAHAAHAGSAASDASAAGLTRRVRVAVAGHGVVGSALVRALQQDDRYDVVRVLVRDARRPRVIPFAIDRLTDDVSSFLETPADIVAEAIGDVATARSIAASALLRGARFVTANKALIATDGAALGVAAGGNRLQFDAAVGGSVPVIRLLRNVLATGTVRGVSGILNGTSNFVLDRLERGASLDSALEEARRRGLAEADPTRDLDGTDTADKLALIAWIAFGVPPHKVRVERSGLLPDPERLVRDARSAGGVARLIGSAQLIGSTQLTGSAPHIGGAGGATGIACAVEPVIVSGGSSFGRTHGEGNRVVVDAGWSAPLELAGPGAGGDATASAMLADIRQQCAPLPAASAWPVAAADPTPHRWIISVLDDARVESPFEAADVPITARARDRGFLRLHVGPSDRAEVRSIVRTLQTIGAQPVLSRVDLDGAS